MWKRIERWASALRRDVLTLWFAARHPGTPLAVKLLALGLAAYALSPIDLVPDFIPVLGYLDEVLILPIGILICLKLLPGPVLGECRAHAARWLAERGAKPRSWLGAALILASWLALGLALAYAWL